MLSNFFRQRDEDERQKEEDSFSDSNCFISVVVSLSVQLYVTNILYIELPFEETTAVTDCFSRPVEANTRAEEKEKRILGCSRKNKCLVGELFVGDSS